MDIKLWTQFRTIFYVLYVMQNVLINTFSNASENTCTDPVNNNDIADMKDMITYLKVEVNRLREKQMQLEDKLNKVTKVAAFSAYLEGGYHYPEEKERIPFRGVLVNMGYHYNSTTSVFTCPVTGIYYFHFSLYTGILSSEIKTPRTSGELIMDGEKMSEAYCINTNVGGIEVMCGNAVLVECKEHGRVWIQSEYGECCLYGSEQRETTFSGFLLHVL